MVELGYTDFISDTFQVSGAAKTPPAIIELLWTKSIEILKTPANRAQLRNNGFEASPTGPDGMRKRIADEVPKWRDIVRQSRHQAVEQHQRARCDPFRIEPARTAMP